MTVTESAIAASKADEFLGGITYVMGSQRPIGTAELLGRMFGLAVPLLVALIAAREARRAR